MQPTDCLKIKHKIQSVANFMDKQKQQQKLLSVNNNKLLGKEFDNQ